MNLHWAIASKLNRARILLCGAQISLSLSLSLSVSLSLSLSPPLCPSPSPTAYEQVVIEEGEEEEEVERDKGEEKDELSWLQVLALSRHEWWLVVGGVLAAAVQGAVFPSFSIFFGRALQVFTFPFNQVQLQPLS